MKYAMVFLIDSGQDLVAFYSKPEGVTNWELSLHSRSLNHDIVLDCGVTVFALLERLKEFRDAGYEVQHFLEVANGKG